MMAISSIFVQVFPVNALHSFYVASGYKARGTGVVAYSARGLEGPSPLLNLYSSFMLLSFAFVMRDILDTFCVL